jgi:hypothetical protein
MIWFHVVLLALSIVLTIAILVYQGGLAKSPSKRIVVALCPFFAVGLFSSLGMSIKGLPTVEWMLPGVLTVVLVFFCPNDQVFHRGWLTMLGIMGVLFVSFHLLVSTNSYTADVRRTLHFSESRNKVLLIVARKAIEEKYPSDSVIQQDTVAHLFNQPSFGQTQIVSITDEWHTFFTSLHRLMREPAKVWYPGGEVKVGVQHLEIRKCS